MCERQKRFQPDAVTQVVFSHVGRREPEQARGFGGTPIVDLLLREIWWVF
jgi:hypothetical protein